MANCQNRATPTQNKYPNVFLFLIFFFENCSPLRDACDKNLINKLTLWLWGAHSYSRG